eukprot:m.160717 g.160717  ORF g.160717 m.160717 type:complete len:349 (-) comp24829_c0_seq27:1054-2100(-)
MHKAETYFMLVTFSSPDKAAQAHTKFLGLQVKSPETHICDLLYVSEISLPHPEDEIEPTTCAICLEALQQEDRALIELLCGHAFHATCLSKCLELSCPVCRFTHSTGAPQCQDCDSRRDLWMCLTCGFIGCSRSQWQGDRVNVDSQGHALQHFKDSGHSYAQELESRRVWDYQEDRYVRRLGQSTNHKLVEMPGLPTDLNETLTEETNDSILLECTFRLTTELENQREEYSNRLAHVEQAMQEKIRLATQQQQLLLQKYQHLSKELVQSTKELSSSTKQISKLRKETAKVKAQTREENELRDSLMKNQELWQKKLADTRTALEQKAAQYVKEYKALEAEVEKLCENLQ